MKIGFIGFGEAAYFISLGLRDEGVSGIEAYDKMLENSTIGPRIKERAEESSVKLLSSSSEVVQSADVLFVAVPAVNAQEVCNEIAEFLTPGQLYIDVTASTPNVKESLFRKVDSTGALFVDAAMLGSLPLSRHQVPITASGSGADKFFEEMSKWGMKITCVGTRAGAASAIKLMRSIFMKGIASLMFEMLQGAKEYDVIGDVVSSISKSMDGISFESHLNRLVTGTAVHAKRRAEELTGSVKMLAERDIDNKMVEAVKYKHEYIAEQLSGDSKPDKYEDYYAVLNAMEN